MAVSAIHQRTRRGRSSPRRTASLLALVVAWAAVFGVAYTLGSRPRAHTTPQPAPPSLATGSSVPAGASRPVGGPRHSAPAPPIAALRPLPPPPALRPLMTASAFARARTYSVPVSRPAPTAGRPASPSVPTGGGPHGSGGTGGGTTTVGGNSGGGGLGTTTSTTSTSTSSTPTGTTPSGG